MELISKNKYHHPKELLSSFHLNGQRKVLTEEKLVGILKIRASFLKPFSRTSSRICCFVELGPGSNCLKILSLFQFQTQDKGPRLEHSVQVNQRSSITVSLLKRL